MRTRQKIKESIYRNKCEIIKRWQDQIRWDQLIKYKMINWREQKSDEVKYKMIKERERTKMRSSGRSGDVCNNKCQDCKLCCNLSLGGAQKKPLSEESTFLLPKVIKYQRIRTFHNKGYYTQTLNWIIDFISHGMVSTLPRCLAQILRHNIGSFRRHTWPWPCPWRPPRPSASIGRQWYKAKVAKKFQCRQWMQIFGWNSFVTFKLRWGVWKIAACWTELNLIKQNANNSNPFDLI